MKISSTNERSKATAPTTELSLEPRDTRILDLLRKLIEGHPIQYSCN